VRRITRNEFRFIDRRVTDEQGRPADELGLRQAKAIGSWTADTIVRNFVITVFVHVHVTDFTAKPLMIQAVQQRTAVIAERR
jgi:hypothetical protein